ncbi:MAG: DUF4296 domain-containing protein [candidate division KSB1 bacterium]|nr:DUF4296 domain-containing protein [candidate division KSB1 bacterium]
MLILVLACSAKTSEPLQDPERFAEVYAKILLANEMRLGSNVQRFEDDKTKLARADTVLRSLGFNRQQFEAAVKYFSEQPELWQQVYAHVVKILEAQSTAADSTKSENP